MNKLDEYTELLGRLVGETVRCTPQTWTHGTLTIDCDGKRIDYKLKNDEESGAALISDPLKKLIDEFYLRMAQRGEPWTQAFVAFRVQDGAVSYKVDFQRPPTAPGAAGATSPAVSARSPESSAAKKPWFKFWH